MAKKPTKKAAKKASPQRQPVKQTAPKKKAGTASKSKSTAGTTSQQFNETKIAESENLSPAEMREALHAEAASAASSPPPASPKATETTAQTDVARILESAKRLGVDIKEEEAVQWLTAITAIQDKSQILVDPKSDVYGAQVAILDFSPKDLEHFRRIGKIVELTGPAGIVETALALSGSAAQSKIQSFPGDADFFERVNIKAPTRAESVKILADAMRTKAQATLNGPDFQLLAVKFGTHDAPGSHHGSRVKQGTPMAWSPQEVVAGEFELDVDDGTTRTVHWEDGMVDPGWCKFDWIVADAVRGQLANASNLLDVTWEAPDGTITPLDGTIDPYFQEVYLDAASVPVFSKLVKQVSSDALAKYVTGLEYEVYKYLVKHPNYGKVAKRTYNIFRMTGRYTEAAYIRELFDEPATLLYRVWSLFETLTDAAQPDSTLDREALLKQYDEMIEDVITNVHGAAEVEIVRALLQARDEVTGLRKAQVSLDETFAPSREQVMTLLNAYFKERLYGFDPVCDYLEEIQRRTYD